MSYVLANWFSFGVSPTITRIMSRIAQPSQLRFLSWIGTRKRGSAATIQPRRPAGSLPRSSSTTGPAQWTGTPRRSSTPMLSCSTLPRGLTAPEIKGYSQEYLDASSLRSQQIREHLEKTGHSTPAAAQIAAHATRHSKQMLTPAEVLTAHKELADEYGNQADRVITQARTRARSQEQLPDGMAAARQAVTYARSSNYEREAVVDERVLMRDALRRGMERRPTARSGHGAPLRPALI